MDAEESFLLVGDGEPWRSRCLGCLEDRAWHLLRADPTRCLRIVTDDGAPLPAEDADGLAWVRVRGDGTLACWDALELASDRPRPTRQE